MSTKVLLVLGVLCLLLCFALVITPHDAFAQEGLETSGQKLGTKEWDKDQLPNKWEMGAGVGSIFVMIAVLKWL